MALTIIDIAIFLIAFLVALYYYALKPYNHFKNTNIKYLKPSIPYLGSMENVLLRREDFISFFKRVYNSYSDEKYIGLFEGNKPMILIKDLELLKKVGIKEFESFHDHRGFVENTETDLFAGNLFAMKGEKWKEMRAALSPAFTSAKMKNMFVYIEECAKGVAQYFVDIKEIKEKGIIEIDVKDTATRYTNDVIASSAFGIEVNSLKDKKNEFYKLGRLASDFGGIMMLKFIGFSLFPKLMNFLQIPFTRPVVTKYFKKLVKETIDNREKNDIVRQDMIHLLIQAKKGKLVYDGDAKETSEAGFATVQESEIGQKQVMRKWTDSDLASQAFIFFVAGFETASTLITFWFYEMVNNPDVQKKLQNEIDDFIASSNGKITYNDVQNLKYLDMTISETLRMWPPLGSIDRVCSKAFTLPPPNNESDKQYTIQKNEAIMIPVYGLMHDPKYFPDPETFKPERFSDDNKADIDPITYLPFGVGPRNCIGSRFALMEIKLIAFHLLSKFDIVPTDKTQIPMKLDKSTLTLKPEKGLFVGLKLRENN